MRTCLRRYKYLYIRKIWQQISRVEIYFRLCCVQSGCYLLRLDNLFVFPFSDATMTVVSLLVRTHSFLMSIDSAHPLLVFRSNVGMLRPTFFSVIMVLELEYLQ